MQYRKPLIPCSLRMRMFSGMMKNVKFRLQVSAPARGRAYASETMREYDKPLTRMRGNPRHFLRCRASKCSRCQVFHSRTFRRNKPCRSRTRSHRSNDTRRIACRSVSCGPCIVSVAVRTAIGAGLHFYAQRNRHGTTAAGPAAQRQLVFVGAFFRSRFFGGFHILWSLGERFRIFPAGKSQHACADCGRADHFVRVAPGWSAGPAESAIGNYSRRCSGGAGGGGADPPRAAVCGSWRGTLLLALDYRVFGTGTGALAESRPAFAQFRDTAGNLEWIPARVRFCVWLDAVHRAHPGDGAGASSCERYDCARSAATRGVFGGTGSSLSADRSGYRTILKILPALPKVSARRRTIQRRAAVVCGRAGGFEQAGVAGGQIEFSEQRSAVARAGADGREIGDVRRGKCARRYTERAYCCHSERNVAE